MASISEKKPENKKQTLQYYEAGANKGDVDLMLKTANFLFKESEDLAKKAKNKGTTQQQKQFRDNSKQKLKKSMKYFSKFRLYFLYQILFIQALLIIQIIILRIQIKRKQHKMRGRKTLATSSPRLLAKFQIANKKLGMKTKN